MKYQFSHCFLSLLVYATAVLAHPAPAEQHLAATNDEAAAANSEEASPSIPEMTRFSIFAQIFSATWHPRTHFPS